MARDCPFESVGLVFFRRLSLTLPVGRSHLRRSASSVTPPPPPATMPSARDTPRRPFVQISRSSISPVVVGFFIVVVVVGFFIVVVVVAVAAWWASLLFDTPNAEEVATSTIAMGNSRQQRQATTPLPLPSFFLEDKIPFKNLNAPERSSTTTESPRSKPKAERQLCAGTPNSINTRKFVK